MNRRRGVGLGLTLFIAILVGYLISTGLKKSEVVSHQDKAISKTVVQRYELKNKTGRLQRDVIFWVYGPVEQTVANRIADVEVSHEYQVDRDDQGNRVMVFQLPQIPPYGSVIIDINSRLKANTEQSDEAMTLLQRYLQAEPLIESDDPRLVKVARLFRQQESEVRAKAVYQWVVENIKRSDYQSRALGAKKTLQTRQGDCTEFAHLYTALARAAGIPARVVSGYRYQGSALMRSDDRHDWAEVLLNKQWRVVDTHARKFLADEDSYIAIMRLDTQGDRPLVGHQRYKVNNKAIRVQQF